MVLKKSKYGGNTGNTLRYLSAREASWKTAAFIVKESCHNHIAADMPKQWLDDGSLPLDGPKKQLRHSVNKHNRWNLSAHLINGIKTKQEQDNIYKNVKNNGVSHENVVLMEKFASFGSRYKHCTLSIYDSATPLNNKKSKSRRGQLETSKSLDTAKVVYTVECTSPSKTWPYHTDGCLVRRKSFKQWLEQKRKNSQQKKLRNYVYYEDEDIYSEELTDDADEVEFRCQKTIILPLESFIKPHKQKNGKINTNKCKVIDEYEQVNPASSERIKKFCKRSFKTVCCTFEPLLEALPTTNLNNDTPIIEDELEDPIQTRNGQLKYVVSEINDINVACRCSKNCIQPSYLTKCFGDSYIEASIHPRTFAVFSGFTARLPKLIFEENGSKDSFCDLNVKILDADVDVKDKLLDMFSKDRVFDIASLCPVIEMANKPRHRPLKKLNCSVIDRKYKPKASVEDETRVWKLLISRYIPIMSDTKVLSKRICSICSSEDFPVSLRECGHTACKHCWQEYISINIKSGFNCVRCPMYNCDVNVDFLAVLFFSCMEIRNRYLKFFYESFVMKEPTMMFCPNVGCSSVAVSYGIDVTSKNGLSGVIPVVDCVCSKKWCFSCGKSEHWPSSCKANELMVNQKNKDLNFIYDERGELYTVTVLTKRCPLCSNPIEKNGGCPHMSCVCGRHFCWKCLQPFDMGYSHSKGCKQTKESEVVLSSTDGVSASRQIKLQRKAYEYIINRNRINSVRVKLNLGRYDIEPLGNSLTAVVSKAYKLQEDCYVLMANLTAARAVCTSKHQNLRILKFVNLLQFLLRMLSLTMNVNKLQEIKICIVLKQTADIENYIETYLNSVLK